MTRIFLPLFLFLSALTSGAQTLREAAGGRVLVGGAVAARDLDDPKLAALVADQFSVITPEYDFMPEHLVDAKGAYTFAAGDRVVAFAEEHHLPVLGHMLVWHFVTRAWLFDRQLNPKTAFTAVRDAMEAVGRKQKEHRRP